jgi:hypothetical protein
MADGFATGNSDSSAEALGILTQGHGHRLNPRDFHGEEVLLNNGRPDGADVGVPTQNRNEVGLPGCGFRGKVIVIPKLSRSAFRN